MFQFFYCLKDLYSYKLVTMSYSPPTAIQTLRVHKSRSESLTSKKSTDRPKKKQRYTHLVHVKSFMTSWHEKKSGFRLRTGRVYYVSWVNIMFNKYVKNLKVSLQ